MDLWVVTAWFDLLAADLAGFRISMLQLLLPKYPSCLGPLAANCELANSPT
jgi:hypothetical protein